ncbi:MAG: 6-carboxytetrahydropterin synthase [Bacteroidota bacterium]
MRISAFRRAHFNAAHRLYRPDWDDDRNAAVFGLCSNEYYHGHNYDLEVRVTGEIDPETGFLIDLKDLKDLIKREVEDYLDHKNLNEQVPEFKTLNPTAENICILIWQRLRAQLDDKYELGVKLWETPRNYVEYPA